MRRSEHWLFSIARINRGLVRFDEHRVCSVSRYPRARHSNAAAWCPRGLAALRSEMAACQAQPLGVSQYRLAKAIDVPASRISEIVAGSRAISADTDLRLCRFLGLSPGYWLRAQAAHDTEVASAELAEVIERIEPLVVAQA